MAKLEVSNGKSGSNSMQGIVWMTFVLVLGLAFMSPSMKTSLDQTGRNSFALTDEKTHNAELRAGPVDSWNADTMGPLQKALNEVPKNVDAARTPSALAGSLN